MHPHVGMFIPSCCCVRNARLVLLYILDPSLFCICMASKVKTLAMVTAQVMPSTPAEQMISTDQLPGSQFAALLAAIRDSEHQLDRKLVDF